MQSFNAPLTIVSNTKQASSWTNQVMYQTLASLSQEPSFIHTNLAQNCHHQQYQISGSICKNSCLPQWLKWCKKAALPESLNHRSHLEVHQNRQHELLISSLPKIAFIIHKEAVHFSLSSLPETAYSLPTKELCILASPPTIPLWNNIVLTHKEAVSLSLYALSSSDCTIK
jgi:hypothetical protein